MEKHTIEECLREEYKDLVANAPLLLEDGTWSGNGDGFVITKVDTDRLREEDPEIDEEDLFEQALRYGYYEGYLVNDIIKDFLMLLGKKEAEKS